MILAVVNTIFKCQRMTPQSSDDHENGKYLKNQKIIAIIGAKLSHKFTLIITDTK